MISSNFIHYTVIVVAGLYIFAPSINIDLGGESFAIIQAALLEENKYYRDFIEDYDFSASRPPVSLAFHTIYSLFGLNPIPYHALGLLMHIAGSLLVYLMAVRIFQNKSIALLSGVLFVSYLPASEFLFSVGYMYDLFFVFFGLCSIASLFYYCETNKGIYIIICVIFGALSIFSKQTAVVLFAILVLLGLSIQYKIIPSGKMDKKALVLITGLLLSVSTVWVLFEMYCGKPPGCYLGGMYTAPSLDRKIDTFQDTYLMFNPFFSLFQSYSVSTERYVTAIPILLSCIFATKRTIYLLLTVFLFLACLPHIMSQAIHLRFLYFPSIFAALLFGAILHDASGILGRYIFPGYIGANVYQWLIIFIIVISNSVLMHSSADIYRLAGELCKSNYKDVLTKASSSMEKGEPVSLINSNNPGYLPSGNRHFTAVQVWGGVSGIFYALTSYGIPRDKLSRVHEDELKLDFSGYCFELDEVRQLTKEEVEQLNKENTKMLLYDLSTKKYIDAFEVHQLTKEEVEQLNKENTKMLLYDLSTKKYIDVSGDTFEEINNRPWESYNNLQSRVVQAGDINGDRETDFVVIGENAGGEIRLLLSTKTGYKELYLNPGVHPTKYLLGDFDGDKCLEVAGWQKDTNRLYVFSERGAVNREWTINGESITILSDVLSCDFDGDGRDDLVFFDKNGFDVFLNNGENFKKWDKIQSDEPLCANGEKCFYLTGDFDGDKKGDFAVVAEGGRITVFSYDGPWQAHRDPGDFGDNDNLFVGDFDGDGKDDIASYSTIFSENTRIRVNLSRGRLGFTHKGSWLEDTFLRHEKLIACDVNGDKRDDVCFYDGSGNFFVCLSTGKKFAPRKRLYGEF